MKKMISWNVNGLRACMKKGFQEYFEAADADIFCLQETKLQEGQIDLELPGYHQYWNYAEKKGYSGTALFTKEEPISVRYGIGIEEHDTEGRVITAEFPEYFVVTVYTPNSQDELKRLAYAGFTKEEREKFAVIKEKGFVDSFRMLYPDTVTYSWWSYRFQARQRNAGWRLDYFMVSESLKDAVADAKIHTEIFGSDHCPVELDLEV